MAKIRNTDNTKRQRGGGTTEILLHCWWQCKMVQPVWKTVWNFLKNILIPHNSTVVLFGIYPKELKAYVHTKTYTQVFIAALLIIAQTWKQPRLPWVGGWINKLWCIQTVEYYWALKRNKPASHEKTWRGTSLAVQWLGLCLPMQGVRVRSLVGELRSHMASQPKNQNRKKKQYCNRFNKGFKNGPHQQWDAWLNTCMDHSLLDLGGFWPTSWMAPCEQTAVRWRRWRSFVVYIPSFSFVFPPLPCPFPTPPSWVDCKENVSIRELELDWKGFQEWREKLW